MTIDDFVNGVELDDEEEKKTEKALQAVKYLQDYFQNKKPLVNRFFDSLNDMEDHFNVRFYFIYAIQCNASYQSCNLVLIIVIGFILEFFF